MTTNKTDAKTPITIPKRLLPFNFCFVNYKLPVGQGWQDEINTYLHDDPKLAERLQKGDSYGVVGGIKDIMIVDADNDNVFDAFKKHHDTLTGKTGDGKHLFYKVPGLQKSLALQEIDIKNSAPDKLVLKNAGHITSTGRMVVGPGCLHYKQISLQKYEPTGKKYKIIKDVDIKTITEKQLMSTIKPFLAETIRANHENKKKKFVKDTPPDDAKKEYKNIDIDISLIAEKMSDLKKQSPGYRGHNPNHPHSKSRMDLTINTSSNTWLCSACCNSGYGFGDSLYLIALNEGILQCHECKKGGLRGDKFLQVKKLAIEKYKVSPDVFPDIKGKKIQPEQETILKEIMIDESTKVIHTNNHIFLARLKPEGSGDDKEWVWKPTKVYAGHVKPLIKMVIDEEFTVFKYTGDTEQVADIPTIIKNMKRGGGVLNKNRFDDCLNAIFLGLDKKIGHATHGIYENKGLLELCLDAMPLRDKQKQVQIRGKPAVTQKITRENLLPYFEVTKNWHPYEVLPSMAAGGISPFALMLRRRGKLVPIIWNCAPVSRLGKSLVQKIFSLYLFNIFPVTGDGIDSKYRLSTVFDCACAYMIVDEAEQVRWKDLEGILKEAPENYLCNIRGTPEQGMIQYLSRAILGINSNRFSITSEHVLVRVFKIEFDTTVVNTRGGNDLKVDELAKKTGELEPIGWRIAEIYLDDIKNSMDVLLERLENHQKKIKKLTRFTDPRRSIAWAILYEGLKVWECAAKKFEIDWHAPSYEDFVTNVVEKIEKSTEDTKEIPIDDFLNWWSLWKVLHIDRVAYDGGYVDTPKGEEILWSKKNLDWRGESLQGEVVTGAILREYQKEKMTMLDNLSDIQKAVTQKTGIPKNKLQTAWKIGGKSKWGCFIPDDLLSTHETQETLLEGDSDAVESDVHTKTDDFLNQKNEEKMDVQQEEEKDDVKDNKHYLPKIIEFIKADPKKEKWAITEICDRIGLANLSSRKMIIQLLKEVSDDNGSIMMADDVGLFWKLRDDKKVNPIVTENLLKQRVEIEKIQAFISEAGGKNKEVSSKAILAFIKHRIGKKDPEKYLQKLKELKIVTNHGNDKVRSQERPGGDFNEKN